MLKISDISFNYGRHKADVLQNFSLDVEQGGVYGLLGPNGAGKSTLLYLIMGVLTPRKGEVTFNGRNTARHLPSSLCDMFLVPEEFDLPAIHLDRYLSLNARFYPRFSYDDLRRNLELFGMDTDVNLGALSMGQKKKVFMSFALSCNTSLLLMDEPTNGLDIPGKSAFRRFVSQSMTDSRTVIISTHQVADVEKLLDNIIIMNRRDVLLNRSVSELQQKLKFIETNDDELIQKALYMIPGLRGASVILPNDGSEETEINLELLFDMAMQRPGDLQRVFDTKQ